MSTYTYRDGWFHFEKELTQATIIKRPNRFIMEILLPDGSQARAHVPVTGSIGSATLDGLPCLVSGPYGGKRSTAYTVEAISFHQDMRDWVGINQTAVNGYVAAALKEDLLTAHPKLTNAVPVKREPRLGSRRLDFLVDSHLYLEVKTPLKHLQYEIPPSVPTKKLTPTTVDRMVAQVEEITKALASGEEALMMVCFLYDNPGFVVPQAHNDAYSKVSSALATATSAGMETWQINFEVQAKGFRLRDFYKLS